jgi:hypothetical protein
MTKKSKPSWLVAYQRKAEARAQAIFDAQIAAGVDPILARLAAATPQQIRSAERTIARRQ